MFNPDTHLYRDEMSSRDLKIGEFDGRVEGGDDVKEVVNNSNNENVIETDDLVMKEKEIESKRSSPVLDEIIMSWRKERKSGGVKIIVLFKMYNVK